MVNQNESSDQNDSYIFRLRNSAIGPWIDSPLNSRQSSPNEEINHLNNDGNDFDDQDVMLQVGNLSLIDDLNDLETSNTMYRTDSDRNNAVIQQSRIDQIDSNQDLDTFGIEPVSEPQDVSVLDFDESFADLNSAITVHDYHRVLQLSNPLEFSIPSADLEEESDQSNTDNFIANFEMSLNRIEDIQREIDEIRQLYNNLLEQEELPIDTALEFPNIVADHENRHEGDIDWGNEIVSVETIENHQDSDISLLDGRISRLDNMDSFSDFFHQLTTVDQDGFNFELEFENDLEEESLEGSDSIESSSWQFDQGQLTRTTTEQRRPLSNQWTDSLLPNFYLDSNGIPRIDFEKQFNLRTRHVLSNDPSSKTPPFCRVDSNGDLECIFAFYSPSSLGELKVSVQDKHQKEVETLLFKEIRNSWRNDHGECIGR